MICLIETNFQLSMVNAYLTAECSILTLLFCLSSYEDHYGLSLYSNILSKASIVSTISDDAPFPMYVEIHHILTVLLLRINSLCPYNKNYETFACGLLSLH